MNLCTPVWASMCIVRLGLLGAAARAQSLLTSGLPARDSPAVVSHSANAMKSFDGLGGTGLALDSLTPPLATLLGAPLADAIQQERNRAYPHARPIPPAIRALLTPF